MKWHVKLKRVGLQAWWLRPRSWVVQTGGLRVRDQFEIHGKTMSQRAHLIDRMLWNVYSDAMTSVWGYLEVGLWAVGQFRWGHGAGLLMGLVSLLRWGRSSNSSTMRTQQGDWFQTREMAFSGTRQQVLRASRTMRRKSLLLKSLHLGNFIKEAWTHKDGRSLITRPFNI